MIIGNWGLGLIFQTSDRRVLTPENLKRTTSAVWATHSRMGLKDQSEFIRPASDRSPLTSNSMQSLVSGPG